MTTTKITVKIWTPMLYDFNKRLDVLCVRRDAFLNKMIEGEILFLAADLEGKRMSSAAKRYIAGQLKRMGTDQVNVVVDKTVATKLNKVVEENNIVRDAFINRMILFLRSNKTFLEYMDLPLMVNGSAFKSSVEQMPTSPLAAIEAVHRDPLYYLREAISERHQSGLYTIDLPIKLIGFSCYIDDAMVPGTDANTKAAKETKELLAELETYEKSAFHKPSNVRKLPKRNKGVKS